MEVFSRKCFRISSSVEWRNIASKKDCWWKQRWISTKQDPHYYSFLHPPYPVTPNCPWTLCPFLLTKWRVCCQTSNQILQPVQTASAHVSSKPALLLLLTLSLFYSPSHLPKVICHLLGNQQTLLPCIKNVQKQIPATTDHSAFTLSSSKLWNTSSLQTLNHSSSPRAWFPIINLVSDQVNTPWICCFSSPNNGLRSSMLDMKSEPYR